MELKSLDMIELSNKYEEIANIAERKSVIADIIGRAIGTEEITPILDKLDRILTRRESHNMSMVLELCLKYCNEIDTNELDIDNVTKAILSITREDIFVYCYPPNKINRVTTL